MRVAKRESEEIKFADVAVGECFRDPYEDVTYMKIIVDKPFNCVNLVDGDVHYFGDCEHVTLLNAEVVIYEHVRSKE